jgi:hypothetical protein
MTHPIGRIIGSYDWEAVRAAKLDAAKARKPEADRLKRTHTLLADEVFGSYAGACTACGWRSSVEHSLAAVETAYYADRRHGGQA